MRACRASEADQARARRLRTCGRTAQRDKLHDLKVPAPDFITTKRDLALALAELYERAGAPSLNNARLSKLTPRTTAWRIVNRKGLPASAEQLVTFLTVCGISRPAAQRASRRGLLPSALAIPLPYPLPCPGGGEAKEPPR
ncbi:hypothetical protein ACF1AO_29985 [Streptomyces longwoodensis]|uniref:hypothetical protein n=1 Tax=Streptomyces longwoodensis TaxID=68231 RepID=UPI0036FA0417